jgi:hypothetical protein
VNVARISRTSSALNFTAHFPLRVHADPGLLCQRYRKQGLLVLGSYVEGRSGMDWREAWLDGVR